MGNSSSRRHATARSSRKRVPLLDAHTGSRTIRTSRDRSAPSDHAHRRLRAEQSQFDRGDRGDRQRPHRSVRSATRGAPCGVGRRGQPSAPSRSWPPPRPSIHAPRSLSRRPGPRLRPRGPARRCSAPQVAIRASHIGASDGRLGGVGRRFLRRCQPDQVRRVVSQADCCTRQATPGSPQLIIARPSAG